MKARSLWQAVALGLGLIVALLLALAHHIPPTRANPSIYYVREGALGDCLSVTTPCSNVQYAINLAAGFGNEVHVAGGVYTENLLITRSIKLQGGWDISFTVQDPISTPTILDGGGITHNVRIAGAPLAEIAIADLTLRNGNDGIHVWSGTVTVAHTIIQDMAEQGLEIAGGTVLVSATQIMTAQQGVKVDNGIAQATDVHIAHIGGEGLFIEREGVVTFTDSIIEDCLQPGVQIGRGSLWLFHNLIRDIQADGVRVEEGAVSIVSNTVHTTLADGLDVSGAHIVGNLIYDTAERGIYVHVYSDALTMTNNVIHDTGSDGIRAVGDLTVAVQGNTVYSAGGDGIDVRGGVVTIAHNRVSGCADNGVRADAGDGNVDIEANWVLSNGIGVAVHSLVGGVAGSGIFSITNNMIGDHITASIELTGTGAGFVAHNTLVGNGLCDGLVILGPLTATVVNNIVVSHSTGITATAEAVLSVSHTLLWDNSDDPISGTLALSLFPSFVAPARQNYRLRVDSPAIDAGIEVGLTTDVDGDPRPVGGSPDIGADEFRMYDVYLPFIIREPSPPPPLAVPIYNLYADPDDLSWLARDPYRDETIPAVFVYEGRSWDVDIRYRGDTARLMPKKCWKVFFPGSDPFRGQPGISYELNLNADYVDQTLLRSYIGYDLLTRAGVSTPRAGYARLYINDVYYGLFSQVEQIDERFLHQFGIEMHGNLYKPFYGNLYTLDHIKDPDERAWWYNYHYPKKTNRESGMEDMIAFIELINYTSDGQFPETIAQVLDVNGWLNWYAVNILIGNYEMFGKNYYLYHDFSTDRWSILPWDVDLALGHNANPGGGGYAHLLDTEISWDNPIDSGANELNALMSRMMDVPEFRFFHCRRLKELMSDEFSSTEMFPRIDEAYEYIYDAAVADPNRWRPDLQGYPGFEDGPDELKTYITNRIQFLEGEMPGFCPNLEVPLTINEFMAGSGENEGWIEIYNGSSTLTWDLSGMYLTNVLSEPTKWRIPDDALVSPGGVLLVWTDGGESEGSLHTNFTLHPAGGQIGLFDQDVFSNTPISVLTYTAPVTNVSYGRMPDGSENWQFFDAPTPGWLNQGRPPIVIGTIHTPTWPISGSAVAVTTVVTDEGNVTVTLWYRAFAPRALPLDYQPMPMAAGADGHYVGSIPGRADGTWVEYYVEAEDEAGMAAVNRPGWPQGDYRYIVGWQRPPLYLNELMAINSNTLKDEAGETDDWLELYNAGPVDIDLGGMYLSDIIDNSTSYLFPGGTAIPAGGYLTLWADGDGSGGHLNFKLAGEGEYVGLFDSQSNYYAPVDAVYFPPQTKDVSWGRFSDGGDEWHAMDTPTPGKPNRLLPPRFSQVVRTPIWPDAGEGVTVTAVITAGTSIISATLWYSVSGEFQAVPMAGGGLFQSGSIYIAHISPQPAGVLVSYYLEAVDDVGQRTLHPATAPLVTDRYLVGYEPPAVLINEFLADNASVNQDEAGEYDDWVELYNAGAVTATLDGMVLTDDVASLMAAPKWQFPVSTTIPPGEHLLVWCDRDVGQGPLHADFKLNRDGEEIGLFDSAVHGLVPLDWIVFGAQQENVSYGRRPDGADHWEFLDPPTPGAGNE
jgi:spore coat protein CotH